MFAWFLIDEFSNGTVCWIAPRINLNCNYSREWDFLGDSSDLSGYLEPMSMMAPLTKSFCSVRRSGWVFQQSHFRGHICKRPNWNPYWNTRKWRNCYPSVQQQTKATQSELKISRNYLSKRPKIIGSDAKARRHTCWTLRTFVSETPVTVPFRQLPQLSFAFSVQKILSHKVRETSTVTWQICYRVLPLTHIACKKWTTRQLE